MEYMAACTQLAHSACRLMLPSCRPPTSRTLQMWARHELHCHPACRRCLRCAMRPAHTFRMEAPRAGDQAFHSAQRMARAVAVAPRLSSLCCPSHLLVRVKAALVSCFSAWLSKNCACQRVSTDSGTNAQAFYASCMQHASKLAS